jgi:hypothetical protein
MKTKLKNLWVTFKVLRIFFVIALIGIITQRGFSQQNLPYLNDKFAQLFENYGDSINYITEYYLLNFPDNDYPIPDTLLIDSLNNFLRKNYPKTNYDYWTELDSLKDQYIHRIRIDSSLFKPCIENMINLALSQFIKSSQFIDPDKLNTNSRYYDLAKRLSDLKLRAYSEYNNRNTKKLINNPPPTKTDNKAFLTPLSVVALLVAILSLLLWIVFFFRRRDQKDTSSDIPKNIKRYISDKLNDPHSYFITTLYKELNEKENILRTEMAKNENKINELIEQERNQYEKIIEIEMEIKKGKESVPTKFYLPFPDHGGFFWDENISSFPQSDTPYILEIDPEYPNTGEFYIDEDKPELIKNAIANYKDFLRPVCNIQDSINKGAKSLKVIKKGKLKKENDKWIIDDNNKLIVSIVT